MFIDYNLYLNDVILGLFVGIGSALANLIVNRGLIRHLEKLEKEVN
jgi:hypothetical protein